MSRAGLVIRGTGLDANLPVGRHGDGVKSVAILLLFQAYIQVASKSVLGEHCEPLLTLEEPEAHLHPQAVRRLARTLAQLEGQKVISTHSPFFLEECDLRDLRVFRRRGSAAEVAYLRAYESIPYPNDQRARALCDRSGGRYFYDEAAQQLVVRGFLEEDDFREFARIAGSSDTARQLRDLQHRSRRLLSEQEMEDLRRYMRVRGEVFFARAWLLCEGQSDYIYFRGFAEAAGFPLDLAGVALIDFQNNGSPAAFVALAEALGYPWIMCCDNDSAGVGYRDSVGKRVGLDGDQLSSKVLVCPLGDMEAQIADNLKPLVLEVLARHVKASSPSDEDCCTSIADILRSDKTLWATRIVQELRSTKVTVPTFFSGIIKRAVDLANGSPDDASPC